MQIFSYTVQFFLKCCISAEALEVVQKLIETTQLSWTLVC